MVPRPTDLPIHSDPGSRSPSRPLRNSGEPSTPIICSPQHRPTSSGSGRSVHELEPMGENLHLPSHESHDESPRQTEDVQGHGRSGSPTVAQEQLVPSSPPDETSTGTSPGTGTNPVSTEQACLSLIIANPTITLDRFVQFAMGRHYNMKEENVVFLEKYKALSTKRQYESNWKKWMAYVTTHKPTQITVDFCVSFFRSLHDKGLA